MFLAKVRVRNFRNLQHLEVGLSKGLNVIVGENNVGKTNLLDAIRAALGSAATAGEPLRLTQDDLHRDATGKQTAEPIFVDLYFQELSTDEQAQFLEIIDFNAAEPAKSTASIHFEWSWDTRANRWHAKRWGGPRTKADNSVPDEVLQSVPLTLLGALRDALVALSPGRTSRLGRLLRAVASDEQKKAIQSILQKANSDLETDTLITDVEEKIVGALLQASGPRFAQNAAIRATEPDFDKMVNNLRLVLRERGSVGAEGLSELRANGLGYNNLLYIATVLAELDAAKDAALPLLLVEEPEAHLHPQLQTLLADYLARGGAIGDHAVRVQTIVTTHSPTIAAHVSPNVIRILHRDEHNAPHATSIADCGLDAAELKKLRRMLDVTRASMLFARSIIFVEGITESLLLPALALRAGANLNLAQAGVAVIPMAGVDFETFGKLFGETKIRVRAAIVTDGDPLVVVAPGTEKKETGKPFKDATGTIKPCDRVVGLLKAFTGNPFLSVFASKVTLEYDLAETAMGNALVVYDAWEACYDRGPRSLKRATLESATTAEERALLLWRALCLGDPAHGKAEVAQELASLLEELDPKTKEPKLSLFTVPAYLQDALNHVVPNRDSRQ